jgi:hypothetical protein
MKEVSEDPWDTIKQIFKLGEGKEKEKDIESLFDEIIVLNISECGKNMDI